MHFGEHQLRSPENPVTQDFGILASSSSSGTRLGLQSSGSPVHYKMGPLNWLNSKPNIKEDSRKNLLPVHLPLGQREASMAEHSATQLSPRPQVTVVILLTRPQQPTWIDSFEKVKALSKKSMLAKLVVSDRSLKNY